MRRQSSMTFSHPLQNRVHPGGEICAVPERGTMLGNRGGRFHGDDQTLGKRRWASHHWIACELHYKDWHHAPMGQGYTSLFFLDEVTALSAGHRPCFMCRRADASSFVTLSGMTTDALDRRLHAERTGPRPVVACEHLPDGAMIEHEGQPFAIRGSLLLHWSFAGYAGSRPRTGLMQAKLLTPPAITAILHSGYKPRWHESALQRGT
jgi:hypothetical protein